MDMRKLMPKKLASNIFLMDYIPQNDLLALDNCKVFVNHGGANGMGEAAYHNVPMVGFPMLVDQFDNVHKATQRGICIPLDRESLTKESILNAIAIASTDKTMKE